MIDENYRQSWRETYFHQISRKLVSIQAQSPMVSGKIILTYFRISA